MPHYADGTPAQIGDYVHGKPYNTPHDVTGVVVGVVPDSDSCNLRVAFTKLSDHTKTRTVCVSGYDPVNPEECIPVRVEVDYGETRAFRKIG